MGDEWRMPALDAEADHMNLPTAPQRGQLHARHEVDAMPLAGAVRLIAPGSRIVVGQRQQLDLALHRQIDQRRRCQQAVGAAAVGVQVDALVHGCAGDLKAAEQRDPVAGARAEGNE